MGWQVCFPEAGIWSESRYGEYLGVEKISWGLDPEMVAEWQAPLAFRVSFALVMLYKLNRYHEPVLYQRTYPNILRVRFFFFFCPSVLVCMDSGLCT